MPGTGLRLCRRAHGPGCKENLRAQQQRQKAQHNQQSAHRSEKHAFHIHAGQLAHRAVDRLPNRPFIQTVFQNRLQHRAQQADHRLEHSQQHIVAHCRNNHARQALTKQQPAQPCVRRAAEELPSAAEQRAEGRFISFCLHFSSSFGA